MTQVKVSEAVGVVLDNLVALALGWKFYPDDSIEQGSRWHTDPIKAPFGPRVWRHNFSPSIDWAQGGPIIEESRIGVYPSDAKSGQWAARNLELTHIYGPTPLIAAMRCYVISKLGEEVDVPDGLIGI